MFISANAQWQKQNVETDAGFRGLSVVNENIIWASGTGGTFIRTIDGGKNWTVGKIPGAEKLWISATSKPSMQIRLMF